MLRKLSIKNIALIDVAEIEFTENLNVLSGETGSGKSVILESLNFVLGAKADKTLIRSGQTECSVRAEFDVSKNQFIGDILDELDIEKEDLLIISRKFGEDGKSSIKVNGSAVNVGMLKKLTSHLVDVHGQSEHFYLLKTSNQLNLIDRFAGEKASLLKETLKKEYSEYKAISGELDALGGDEGQRRIRSDILDYQIKEIENADLKEGEEEELLSVRQKIQHVEKIGAALNGVKEALSSEGNACDLIGMAAKSVSSIANIGTEYSSLHERIMNAVAEINDISDSVDDLLDDLDAGEYDIDFIENRLETIKSLKKKYGDTVAEIYEYLSKAKEEKDKLENFEINAEKLLERKEKSKKTIYGLYGELRKLRENFAERFSGNVIKELKELGMKGANFEIRFDKFPSYEECAFSSANGADELEFYFSANSGEPLKPMSAVISGGEMSRFMLAIKTQTAGYNETDTFVFDEIDAGISGNVAKVVSEKFASVSKAVQIIAITHLPQISAIADNNLLITKTDDGANASTTVKTLSQTEKVDEIIRLIGGRADSETARMHAIDLINEAAATREKIRNEA